MSRFLDSQITTQRQELDRQMELVGSMQKLIESAYYADVAGEPQGLKRHLENIAQNSTLDGIEIVNARGHILYSTDPARRARRGPREKEMEEWAARARPVNAQIVARDGRIFIYASRGLFFAAVDLHAKPEMICNAWMELDSTWAQTMASRTGMGVALLDDGKVTASSLQGTKGQRWLAAGPHPSLTRAITVTPNAEQTNFRMQVFPVSIRRQDDSIHLAVGSALTGMRLEMERTRRYVLLLTAFAAAAVFVVMAWALSLLAPSLRRLVTASQIIAKEGPEYFTGVEVRPSDPSEVQLLAEHFNLMARALKERIEVLVEARWQLHAANSELESRIVTKTAQLERSMKSSLQSEKLAAVGQLAAGVAHEINNPLGVILGFAQSVSRHLPAGDPLALPLNSIEREALRCKTLVASLLSFSRQNGITFGPVDLDEALASALALIEAQTRVHGVELECSVASQGLKLHGNSGQIQQVVVNLCSNAIDAMPGGGKLTVRVGLSSSKNGYAEIRVSDTGGGIPDHIRAKIFDPFFTTKEVGKGTGLGLSLVYEIIVRHSGSLDFESAPGEGTTFRVQLPLAKKTEEPKV